MTHDTTMTGGAMIQDLEDDGCRVQCTKVVEDYGTAEWRVKVSWPTDGGTYAIERRLWTDNPIGAVYHDVKAIRAMQAAGYRVLMDETSDHRFRVRVQRFTNPRTRSRYRGVPVYAYNVTTASTSGYPVMAAYAKWRAHRAQEGGAS